uniref:regulatory protein ToxS n=1 Tax=Thaumasiovibrio occultus TaxID=1891184 RepID=UPI000B35ED3B|nr:regulatory protein ToxS [Thaumasiovibrio occultus]
MPIKKLFGVFKHIWHWLLLIASLGASAWYYLDSDHRIERMLSQNKWQSAEASNIELKAGFMPLGPLEGLNRLEQTTQMVFMPNRSFSRFTHLILQREDDSVPLQVHISETGHWEVSGGYLQMEISDFSDVVSSHTDTFSDEELAFIRQYYLIDSKQSRRVDVLSPQTILLTSLNNGSRIMVAQ